MTLAEGSQLGPYQILSPVGAGGMGEVYRAKDTRLDRIVAIKVLPSHLSENAEIRQRFDREAKTISSLSHPHICALHDVGHQDGTDYLVMEFLEGESLADRLAKGPLPTEQALRYGIQIADALDRAHRQGIVHRDLKPGNVMLTKSGVKLVDFGLAKLAAAGPVASSLSILPTQAGANLTQDGTILGTFQYMSPEQLEGKEADARSDIFAFGAVLYEMATGNKAFAGKSQASLIAAILDSQPAPISTVQPMSPPALDRVVQTCLAKDPDDRWQTAHDVMLELKWIAEGGSQAGVPAPVAARRVQRERTAWIAAALFAAAALALATLYFATPRRGDRIVRTSILPPSKTVYRSVGESAGPPAISPDGLTLAFTASDTPGRSQLWVRSFDAAAPRALPGTEGTMYPFWSPDSKSIGFFCSGKLKKVDAAGGPVLTICDAADGRGGTWGRDGVIVFEPHFREPLARVSASGGLVTAVTKLDESRRETTHRFPFFLPDGKHFLYEAGSHAASTESELHAIYIGSLDQEPRKFLLSVRSKPVYAAGHLLFVRQKTLMAQRLDWKKGRLIGDAFPIAENVQDDPGYFTAVFTASDAGVLAYQEGGGSGGLHELAWFDRSGKKLETIGSPGIYWAPRISSDGRRVVISLGDPADIWFQDLARHIATRMTFDPADETNPVWSPDGSQIFFASQRSGAGDLYRKSSSGGSDELILSSKEVKAPLSVTPDGRTLLFESLNPKTKWDLLLLSLPDRKVTPLLQTEFDEVDGQFSPDGKWVAYASNESGRFEVYVQPFPGPGGKWQVSTAGGSNPAWRRDGRELFYLSLDKKLTAVPVRTGAAFESETPTPLFPASILNDPDRHYDVAADGQRFLIVTSVGDETPTPLTLVQNWTTLLRK